MIKKLYEDIESKINKDEFKKIMKKSRGNFEKICTSGSSSYSTKMFCDGVGDYFVSYNVAKFSAPYMCGK